LRPFSFVGYGLARAALALVVFGAIECFPQSFAHICLLRNITEKCVILKASSEYSVYYQFWINPLPPSDAVRRQKKHILEDLFSSVFIKKY